MKKLQLLLILVFCTTLGFSQVYILDSVVSTTAGERNISFHRYSKNDRKAEYIQYKLLDTSDVIYHKNSFQEQYDENGNLLFSMYSEWNPALNVWDTIDKRENKYDTDNNCIESTSYKMKLNKWIVNYQTITKFDSSSRIAIDYEIRDSLFGPVEKTIWSNGLLGRKKSYHHFQWDKESSSWLNSYFVETLFLNDTLVIGEVNYRWEEGQWVNERKLVYALDADGGKGANYILYEGLGEGWMPLEKFEKLSSLENGNEVNSFCRYEWLMSSNGWQLMSENKVYENEKGLDSLVLFFEHREETGQLKLISKNSFIYDTEGRELLRQEIYYDSDTRNGVQYATEYDKDGNLIQWKKFNLNPDYTSWTEEKRTLFFYEKRLTQDLKNNDLLSTSYVLNDRTVDHPKYPHEKIELYEFVNKEMVLVEKIDYFYSEEKR